MQMLSTSERRDVPAVSLVAAIVTWGVVVAVLAGEGAFARLIGPSFGILVVAGILVPTAIALGTKRGRRTVAALGLLPLTLLHVWRVPAALLFFSYGAAGLLPPAFWVPAGAGDFIVGLLAARVLTARPTLRFYWRFHIFGFTDFVIAVGSGLLHTLLLHDPRMQPITQLPLALIPLFAVGLSGASHLVSFKLLADERRRQR